MFHNGNPPKPIQFAEWQNTEAHFRYGRIPNFSVGGESDREERERARRKNRTKRYLCNQWQVGNILTQKPVKAKGPGAF